MRRQLGLLILANLFVGGMVGLERTILPLIAEEDFALASHAAAVAFIATFGASKAIVNLFAGHLADSWGRRKTLLLGWLFGLPVPLLLMLAPSWSWILFANVLLGINQGLTWSMTVVMKVDLVRPNERGLVVGLNEFAGYGGLALAALLTGFLASRYGLRPEPFYLGVGVALAGLVISGFIRDTGKDEGRAGTALIAVFREVSWKSGTLSASSFAGSVTNLKDGMLWGLLPLFLLDEGLGIRESALIIALYPAVWSIGQLLFGPLSDRLGRKALIVLGMALQAAGILAFVLLTGYGGYLVAAIVVGLGTAMVYPTLAALVFDVALPLWRASAQGVYRFWRDLGYALGALGAGLVADILGIPAAMVIVAGLALMAAIITALCIIEPR